MPAGGVRNDGAERTTLSQRATCSVLRVPTALLSASRHRADVMGVVIAPARLRRLLSVLVVGFALAESWPLLKAVELFRGMSIQLAYRWPIGQIAADPADQAVLLWSTRFAAGGKRSLGRQLCGVLAATVTGVVLVLIGNAMLLLPLHALLSVAGVGATTIVELSLAIVGGRLLGSLCRAIRAYRHDAAVMSVLPPPTVTRWRIDYLAAAPPRRGHGGRLLDEFLSQADEHDAEVVLHCVADLVSFYRRHGFELAAREAVRGQYAMVRAARSQRRELIRQHHLALRAGRRRRQTRAGSGRVSH